MGNLNCNAASCMHNCDNQCCLNSICVEGSSACQCGETCCSDYEHQKPGATNMCHLPKILYPSHVKQPTAYITLIKNVMLTMQTYQV